jgi:hypothetical protein
MEEISVQLQTSESFKHNRISGVEKMTLSHYRKPSHGDKIITSGVEDMPNYKSEDRIMAIQLLYKVRRKYKHILPCETVQCLITSHNCFLPDSLHIIIHNNSDMRRYNSRG